MVSARTSSLPGIATKLLARGRPWIGAGRLDCGIRGGKPFCARGVVATDGCPDETMIEVSSRALSACKAVIPAKICPQ